MSCCEPLAVDGEGEVRKVVASMDEQRLLAAARGRDDGALTIDFTVPGMHCAACIGAIERGLAALPQVRSARANLSLRRVTVTWDADAGTATEIDRRLDELGYSHAVFDPDLAQDADDRQGRQLLLSLAVAGFAAANIMLLSISVWSGAEGETARLFHLLSGLIAAPAIVFAGRPFFASALSALRARRLNMDVPISLAVGLAFAMSLFEALTGGDAVYFDASVTLLFFLLIGRYLDHMMRDRARNAVIRLNRLAARGATVIGQGGERQFVPTADIRPGMRILVAPGERVPVDGRLIGGASDLDRSLVSGESMPVAVGPGDEMEAGTLNLTGAVEIEALRDADHSFLADVLQMLDAAENGRGDYVRIADRMAAIYAPAVHGLAALAFAGWMIATGGDWRTSIYVAIAVLIVTCPCALGLAVPVVNVIGAARLFAAGVMMKDGSALERLAGATMAVFDKTGTLTTGIPAVLAADFPDDAQAAIARALARQSAHPAARSLDECIAAAPAAIDASREFPGFGVEARTGGRRARLGRAAWVAEIAARAPRTAGLAFAVEGDEPVSIPLTETLRPGAAEAVAGLEALGIGSAMLSGDSADNARPVARAVAIERISAGNTPAAKIEYVAALKAEGERVLMIGDGLNDAPALAVGNVSMAPASGSDAGRLAADFVIIRDSLAVIPFAVSIARRAGRLVRQNFALAIAYNCIAVPLALAGHVTPLVAAIAMSASSILVVANSMRLNFGGRVLPGRDAGRRPHDLALAG